jgi:uroporphyrinogen decarboxylase
VTGVERVFLAINHREADRVPKGEWSLGPGLISALMGKDGPPSFEDEAAARELLGMDLVAVAPDGCSLIDRWRRETDLFVFALVDGPFERIVAKLGFVEFMTGLGREEHKIAGLAAREAEKGVELARRCLEAGAHGVIIADDIAYNRGTLIRPDTLRRVFLPLWRGQVQALTGVPVFFHADGNFTALLADLVGAGFAGLHSLEPGAGMDIGQIKQEHGHKLCLWGNVDLGWLVDTKDEEQIAAGVRDLMGVAAPGGGYIFATAAGCLWDNLPAERVLALYRAAGEYGYYAE